MFHASEEPLVTEARDNSQAVLTRPVVHIGFHKTATSWFQAVYYPHLSSHRYVDRRVVRRTLLGGNAFEFDPSEARSALGFDAEGLPPLLCEEDLSGTLHLGLASGYVAKEVARRIFLTAPEAQIVIFVRSQTSAALSWYLQYVREGGTGGPLRYLFPEQYRHIGHDRPFRVPRFDFSQLDYRGLIETYDAKFGRSNVHVYAYESFVKDRAAVLRAMNENLNVEVDARALSTKRVNDSYRRSLIPIARTLNLFTSRSVSDKRSIVHVPYLYAARKELLKVLNRMPIFGKRPVAEQLLGHQALEWIAQRFSNSNRWLANRMNTDLAALGYPLHRGSDEIPPPSPSKLLRWTRN